MTLWMPHCGCRRGRGRTALCAALDVKDDDDRRSTPSAPRTAVGVRPRGARPGGAGGDDGGPAMAPQIPEAALPGLNAKVNAYVDGLMAAQIGSPEMAGKADDIRLMGDADIRAAADTSNRLLQMPGQGGASEGGVSGPRRSSKSLLDLRATVEEPGPQRGDDRQEAARADPVRRLDDRLLPPVRVARRSSSTRSSARCTTARTSSARTTRRSTWRSATSGTRWPGCNQYIFIAERIDTRLSATIAELDATDPERAQGAARGRPVLRPPEAPGPAHPARGLDPGLPRDRHHHQEQPRAHQGRRPRDHDHASPPCAPPSSSRRRWQPEARARPDHGPEHHDVGPHRRRPRKMLAEQSADIQEQAASATVGHRRSCSRRSRTSTPRWTRISTFKVKALDSMATDHRRAGDRDDEGAPTTSTASRRSESAERRAAARVDGRSTSARR